MKSETIMGIVSTTDAIGYYCRYQCVETLNQHDCECETCALYNWNPLARREPSLAWFVDAIKRRQKADKDKARRRSNG